MLNMLGKNNRAGLESSQSRNDGAYDKLLKYVHVWRVGLLGAYQI
jgi:hypothetical protein